MAKQQAFQRRRPHQARAQFTYDSILQAAVQILERSGADALNTNAVAERAGVSIGTLYQYFPDKESILLAVARREMVKPQLGLAVSLLEALVRTLESLLRGGAVPARRVTRRNAVSRPTHDTAAKMEALLSWMMPVPALRPLRSRYRQPRRA